MDKEDFEIAKELTTREKKLQVMELKKAGWSNRQIAVKFGMKPNTIKKWISDELRYLREKCSESLMEMIEIQSMQYDEVLRSFWEDAIEHRNYRAADIILRVWERKAKLLGLDAPEKQVRVDLVSTDTMNEAELLEQAKLLGLPVPETLLGSAKLISQTIKEDPIIPPLPPSSSP